MTILISSAPPDTEHISDVLLTSQTVQHAVNFSARTQSLKKTSLVELRPYSDALLTDA
jgi:hypothetical protein